MIGPPQACFQWQCVFGMVLIATWTSQPMPSSAKDSEGDDKPAFLSREYSSAFEDSDLALAYRHRPPYPAETFRVLSDLMAGPSRRVLDLGCGTGFICRPLALLTDHIDAVDLSEAMPDQGRISAGGDHPNIEWRLGPAETVTLSGLYDLITLGESLQWMDWPVIMLRASQLLTEQGLLVILRNGQGPVPWGPDLMAVIRRFETPVGQDRRRVDLERELTQRGLFKVVGRARVGPEPYVQSVADYIEGFHGRSTLSRERMARANAESFDGEVRELIERCGVREVTINLHANIVWGRPIIDGNRSLRTAA